MGFDACLKTHHIGHASGTLQIGYLPGGLFALAVCAQIQGGIYAAGSKPDDLIIGLNLQNLQWHLETGQVGDDQMSATCQGGGHGFIPPVWRSVVAFVE